MVVQRVVPIPGTPMWILVPRPLACQEATAWMQLQMREKSIATLRHARQDTLHCSLCCAAFASGLLHGRWLLSFLLSTTTNLPRYLGSDIQVVPEIHLRLQPTATYRRCLVLQATRQRLNECGNLEGKH